MGSLMPAESMKELLANRQMEYAQQLPGSPAEDYLLSRGITKQAMDFFGLGYVGIPMKDDQRHAGRVTIPYFTRSGVVQMRSMSVEVDGVRPEPKMLPWFLGDKLRLYNTTALSGTVPEVFLCEGEMDTIVAWQLGLYAVGVPGVKNWKKLYTRIFRYRKVTILADNDDQGQGLKMAEDIAKQLEGAAIVKMDPGHDLNSLYQAKGPEYILKLINGG